ncbi:hypothetical protein PSTT_06894 [Puccinia striiformis]|uniref:Restriction of telomere capping protein 4 n=1 Tax=Puccinia striiformis TaxID=27350 RepID=A0A2S4VIF6_9BASI|nr:hypothetical protein PSTT_06894 [Puccinia striiformis]
MIVLHMPNTKATRDKWMSRLDAGPSIANAYNRPVVFLYNEGNAGGTLTYIPATKTPPPSKKPGPIIMVFINQCHWILVETKRGVIPFPGPTLSKSLAQSPMADWMLAISSSTSLYESVVSSNVRETQKEGTLTVRTGTVDLMEQLKTTLGNHGMEFQMPTKPNLRISCQQPNLDLEELRLPDQEMVKVMQYLQGVPEVKICKNSSNPAALYLPVIWPFGTHCDLHRAETSLIPLGISKGWPLTINFESLPDLVTVHQKYLKQICTGEIDSTFLRQALEFWKNLGPTKAQIIIHTLNHIFPESLGILHHLLSNEFLLSRVFVPEVAKCLIAEDFGLDVTDPKVQEHLEESRRFGTIVFPDKDDLVAEKDESIE